MKINIVVINENQLVEECLKGTQRAFKTIYENYKGYVYTICIRYGVSQIEIKDSMQIIFTEVFSSLKNYDNSKESNVIHCSVLSQCH